MCLLKNSTTFFLSHYLWFQLFHYVGAHKTLVSLYVQMISPLCVQMISLHVPNVPILYSVPTEVTSLSSDDQVVIELWEQCFPRNPLINYG